MTDRRWTIAALAGNTIGAVVWAAIAAHEDAPPALSIGVFVITALVAVGLALDLLVGWWRR